MPHGLENKYDNNIELWGSEEYKIICRRCGGRGLYLMQWQEYENGPIVKKEMLNCEECETGFRYGEKEQVNGFIPGRIGK